MAPFVSPSKRTASAPSRARSRSRSRSRSKTRRNSRNSRVGLGNFHRVFREVLKLDSPPASPTRPLSPRLGNLARLQSLSLFDNAYASPPRTHRDSHARADTLLLAPRPVDSWSISQLVRKRVGIESSQQTLVEDLLTVDTEGVSNEETISKVTTPATTPELMLDTRSDIHTSLNFLQIQTTVGKKGAAANGILREQEDAFGTQLRVQSTLDAVRLSPPATSTQTSHYKIPDADSSSGSSDSTLNASLQLDSQEVYATAGSFALNATTPHVEPPAHSLPFLQVAQAYRADVAVKIVALHNLLTLGDILVLPWDHHGNYTTVMSSECHRVGLSKSSDGRLIVEPLYRLTQQTQLQLVKARLAVENIRTLPPISSPYAIPQGVVPPGVQLVEPVQPVQPIQPVQPVHVFVDLSNIVISFYDCIKNKRGIAKQYAQTPAFFFGALATILERGRYCQKRVLVGSLGPGKPQDDFVIEAIGQNYQAHILQRVKGPKPSRQAANILSTPNAPSPSPHGHHEQGVDEILQLHILQSIVDTPTPIGADHPGVMVLATGDGAETDFSDGFYAQVERALKNGWFVEVVSFRSNMHRRWDERRIPEQWRSRFTRFELDPFVEELLVSFRG